MTTADVIVHASIMEQTGKPHPKSHNLARLALLLRKKWPSGERELFDSLSEFSVAARYDDPAWAKQFATMQNTRHWIERTQAFLSHFLP